MRWIILTLVVANLALGGYLYWQSTLPEEKAVKGNSAQLNNLALDEATRTRLNSLDRQTVAPAQDEPKRQPLQCIRISGFSGDDQVGVIESRLRALEVPVEREQQQEVIRTDYWVVMGPFAAPGITQDQLNELRAREIDSFLITKGPLSGAISLGLFSSRANAERLRERLAAQGVTARIEQVERTRDITMLTIDQQGSTMISEDALESIVEPFEGVSYQRYRC